VISAVMVRGAGPVDDLALGSSGRLHGPLEATPKARAKLSPSKGL
jgi:hypothetical protein